MAPAEEAKIYSATYSNVPVYELSAKGKSVMRRQKDSWINATHILKIADLDKPARTRVLEKEVQLDTHEKIQGGYGKYQGTWVPLNQGIVVAQKYNVYNILKPIFDFEAGSKSPPPAPKHTIAASSKPKVPRASGPRKITKPKKAPQAAAARREQTFQSQESIEDQMQEDLPDEVTIDSRSHIDDMDEYRETNLRRRTQEDYERQDKSHRLWADQLLDYFMMLDSDPDYAYRHRPQLSENSQIDRPVDSDGHTALHWACAMGDIEVAKELLQRNASIHARNVRGETPLIRAGLFANCYDKGTWEKVVHMLQQTIMTPDFHGGTVFHHVALTAIGGSKATRARQYLDVLLHKLSESTSSTEFLNFLNMRDRNGDTAFHMAARLSRRCSKLFMAYNVPSDIPNNEGETVDDLLFLKNKDRSKNGNGTMIPSSSPVAAGRSPYVNGGSPRKSHSSIGPNLTSLRSVPSQSFERSFNTLVASQLTSFLEAGEAEMEEKEVLLEDIKHATERADREASAVRQRTFALKASLDNDEDNNNLHKEFKMLLQEAERLEEQVQHRAIHKFVRQEENAPAAMSRSTKPDAKADLSQREELAHSLDEEQQLRRQLVRDLVVAEANAGMTDKGQHLMAIVSKILGKGREEVAEVTDEILEHLEASRIGLLDMMDMSQEE